MTEYDIALQIATKAHEGQKDKMGADYILHPLAVASMCVDSDYYAAEYRLKAGDAYLEVRQTDLRTVELGKKSRVVALLHDVVEDTSVTLQQLREAGICEDVVAAVDALTKREGEPLSDYHRRVAASDLAIVVKFSDMAHNTSISRATCGDRDWLPNPLKPPKLDKAQYIQNCYKYGERAYELKQLVGEKFACRSYDATRGMKEVAGLLSESVYSGIQEIIRKYLVHAGIVPKTAVDDYFAASDDLRSFWYKVEKIQAEYDPKINDLLRRTPREFFVRVVCFDDDLRTRIMQASLTEADIRNAAEFRRLKEFEPDAVITREEGAAIFQQAAQDRMTYQKNISSLIKWAEADDDEESTDYSWARAVFQSFYYFFLKSNMIERIMRLSDSQLAQTLLEQQVYDLLQLTEVEVMRLKCEYQRDW